MLMAEQAYSLSSGPTRTGWIDSWLHPAHQSAPGVFYHGHLEYTRRLFFFFSFSRFLGEGGGGEAMRYPYPERQL